MRQIGVVLRKGINSNANKYFSVLRKDFRRDWILYLMLFPFLTWLFLFAYKPMTGLQIAFKDYSMFKGISASPWVGFYHFKVFFESPYFFSTLKNTLVLGLMELIIGFPIPIIFALLLNEAKNKAFAKGIHTISLLPHFISTMVLAGMVVNFLSPSTGIVNHLIEMLGGERIYFLVKPQYFRAIYIAFVTYQNLGYSAILYIAALSAVQVELYEAAFIDGASRWKQLWHVTIPGILPTIVIMFIIKVGQTIMVGYQNIILLYQPATYEVADVISTYVFRTGVHERRYDFATAVGLFNAVVSFLFVYVANKISKKVSDISLW